MDDNIFIPQKIKVGFQNRSDTYTKRLAYVIYYDEKGKLRKEASWSTWRDDTIPPEEYDNAPTEGFVLNKKAGGYKTGWDIRQTYVRVYDPRGFEFEITIPNLLYILENTNSIKGKGLEGEFVYGWSGSELVLLPVSSPDYAKLQELNAKRFNREFITTKNLKLGFIYRTKSNKEYIYMGHFNAYDNVYRFDGKEFPTQHQMEKYARENDKPLVTDSQYRFYAYGKGQALYTYGPGCIGKRYFFATDETYDKFTMMKSISGKFIEEVSNEPVPNYAELMDQLESETMYSPLDPSKNVISPCDLTTMKERLNRNQYWWGTQFLTRIGDDIEEYNVYIDRSIEGPAKYKCEFATQRSTRKMRDIFGYDKTDTTGLHTVNITIEEIFENLPPCYIDQYLANGKYYRRSYQYE